MGYAPEDTIPRGWSPVRGIPPAARTASTPDSLKKGGSDFSKQGAKAQRPPSPRSQQNSGSTRIHGGEKQRNSAKDSFQSSRNQRHTRGGASCSLVTMASAADVLTFAIAPWPCACVCPRCADFKTETERSYQMPENFGPVEDEYGRPERRLFSGRIKKRVRFCPLHAVPRCRPVCRSVRNPCAPPCRLRCGGRRGCRRKSSLQLRPSALLPLLLAAYCAAESRGASSLGACDF